MTTLRLILGDQLNQNHSWFQNPQKGVHYLMMEMRQETDYVTHHIQKVCTFFLAMRRFAGFLENQGFQVHYLKLDDPGNAASNGVRNEINYDTVQQDNAVQIPIPSISRESSDGRPPRPTNVSRR